MVFVPSTNGGSHAAIRNASTKGKIIENIRFIVIMLLADGEAVRLLHPKNYLATQVYVGTLP